MFVDTLNLNSYIKLLRCPNCGSTMVIEADNKGGEYDEAVAVGIPVCEVLDLESIAGIYHFFFILKLDLNSKTKCFLGAKRASCMPEPEVSRGSQPENTYLGVDAGNTLKHFKHVDLSYPRHPKWTRCSSDCRHPPSRLSAQARALQLRR